MHFKTEPVNISAKSDSLATTTDTDVLQKLRQEMQKLAMVGYLWNSVVKLLFCSI